MLGQFERVLMTLVAAHVDFMVVGGVTVVMHGHLRTTKAAELERARAMTPAERLRWLDQTYLELSGWVGAARRPSQAAGWTPGSVPRNVSGSRES